jgi:hypothetical protein
MTKKDYELIARAIYTTWNWDNIKAVKLVALRIAERLGNDNSRFDQKKFYKTCGFGDDIDNAKLARTINIE